MSTSVLDYIFRELAVSYLGRNDLAHVEPSDMSPDSLGRGDSEGDLPPTTDKVVESLRRLASTGYIRNQLLVLDGGSVAGGRTQANGGPVPQVATLAVEESVVTMETTVQRTVDGRLELVREARLKGYEGDPCNECGNFTLVRNGTCLKCATCGGTSGCS
jgi:ribonucleoside-diphosphate reductase alpha chain